jgi:hypothetical protein
MNGFIRSAATYKLAIVVGALFSINALALAVIGALSGVEWGQVSPTKRFLICSAILANWTNTLLAFFNRTLARIEQGKPAIETGDTDIITKPK